MRYKIMRDFHGNFWIRDLTANPKDTAVKDEHGMVLEFGVYEDALKYVERLEGDGNKIKTAD